MSELEGRLAGLEFVAPDDVAEQIGKALATLIDVIAQSLHADDVQPLKRRTARLRDNLQQHDPPS
jgi:hypothetical protein